MKKLLLICATMACFCLEATKQDTYHVDDRGNVSMGAPKVRTPDRGNSPRVRR